MQNKKWLAAVAVGLGVLAGAAQATQMVMTIEGNISDQAGSSFDAGSSNAWNTPSQARPTKPGSVPSLYGSWLVHEPASASNVSIRILFPDSFTNAPYTSSDDTHSYAPNDVPGVIYATATFNGVSHTVSSAASWDIVEKTPLNADDYLSIQLVETYNGRNIDKGVYPTLTFAGSSGLQQLMMGNPFNSPIKSGNVFFYFSDANYSSKLTISPRSLSIAPVPEPETWAMMAAGLGLVGFAARRRSR